MDAKSIGVSFDGSYPLGQTLGAARGAVTVNATSLWMAEHLGHRGPITSCMAFASSFPGVKIVPTAISPMNAPAHLPAAALWAVVPVKRFAAAKRRLSPLLAPHECAELARSMLIDVLQALAWARPIAGILVVTDDPEAAALARRAGAEVTGDGVAHAGDGGVPAGDHAADPMLRALTRAMLQLADGGRAGALILPADIPGVTGDEIATLADAHRGAPAVTVVPARADGGTNALACTPPQAIALRFGDDSFRRHCAAARRAGIEPTVLELPGIGLDIDRPSDLARFLARPAPTRTHEWLVAAGIAQRLPGGGDSTGAVVAGAEPAASHLLATAPDAAVTP